MIRRNKLFFLFFSLGLLVQGGFSAIEKKSSYAEEVSNFLVALTSFETKVQEQSIAKKLKPASITGVQSILETLTPYESHLYSSKSVTSKINRLIEIIEETTNQKNIENPLNPHDLYFLQRKISKHLNKTKDLYERKKKIWIRFSLSKSQGIKQIEKLERLLNRSFFAYDRIGFSSSLEKFFFLTINYPLQMVKENFRYGVYALMAYAAYKGFEGYSSHANTEQILPLQSPSKPLRETPPYSWINWFDINSSKKNISCTACPLSLFQSNDGFPVANCGLYALFHMFTLLFAKEDQNKIFNQKDMLPLNDTNNGNIEDKKIIAQDIQQVRAILFDETIPLRNRFTIFMESYLYWVNLPHVPIQVTYQENKNICKTLLIETENFKVLFEALQKASVTPISDEQKEKYVNTDEFITRLGEIKKRTTIVELLNDYGWWKRWTFKTQENIDAEKKYRENQKKIKALFKLNEERVLSYDEEKELDELLKQTKVTYSKEQRPFEEKTFEEFLSENFDLTYNDDIKDKIKRFSVSYDIKDNIKKKELVGNYVRSDTLEDFMVHLLNIKKEASEYTIAQKKVFIVEKGAGGNSLARILDAKFHEIENILPQHILFLETIDAFFEAKEKDPEPFYILLTSGSHWTTAKITYNREIQEISALVADSLGSNSTLLTEVLTNMKNLHEDGRLKEYLDYIETLKKAIRLDDSPWIALVSALDKGEFVSCLDLFEKEFEAMRNQCSKYYDTEIAAAIEDSNAVGERLKRQGKEKLFKEETTYMANINDEKVEFAFENIKTTLTTMFQKLKSKHRCQINLDPLQGIHAQEDSHMIAFPTGNNASLGHSFYKIKKQEQDGKIKIILPYHQIQEPEMLFNTLMYQVLLTAYVNKIKADHK